MSDPSDALIASPRFVTLNPPKPRKPAVGKARGEPPPPPPPPPPPHATFKLTAVRAVDSPVIVRYVLSGAGAAGLIPPPSASLIIQSCTWAVTIPREVVERATGAHVTSRLHLITVIHGVPDAERSTCFAAARHIVRELQPQSTGLIESAEAVPARVCAPLGPAERLLTRLDTLKASPSPPAPPARVALGSQAAEKERGTEGLLGGVMAALDLALNRLEKEREQRLLRATAQADRDLWALPPPPFRARDDVVGWCRRAVDGIVLHAASLGAAGKQRRQRWVEQSATAHAKHSDRQQDSLFMIQIVQYGPALARAPDPLAGNVGFALPTDVLSVASRRISGSGLKLAVRLLMCSDDAEPATALAAKAALQTIVAWEPTPLYVALTRKALPAAVRQLSQDAQRCCFATPLSLALPPIARVLHAGFVTQIGQPPVWSTSLRLMPSEGVCLLFEGPPPHTFLLNGCEVTARLRGPLHRAESAEEALCRHAFLDPPLLVQMLRLVQRHVCALRVAAGRRTDVVAAVKWLRQLVMGLSAPPVKLAGLDALHKHALDGALADPSQRHSILRERRRMASDLMVALKEVDETALLAAAAAGSQGLTAASFLSKPSELKFGAKVLRRVARSAMPAIRVPSLLRGLLSVQSRHESQDRGGDGKATWTGDEAMPLSSHKDLAERALSMWAELLAFANAALRRERTVPPGVGALLYSFGMVGIQLRVGRSEAAAINPWAIRIEYLSRTPCDTVTALSALDCGHQLTDSTGELAPDVLPLIDPALGGKACEAVAGFVRSSLYATHLALLFTRSPALRLPAQRAALLVVSFAKAAEQLLRRRGGERVAEPRVTRQPSRFQLDTSVEDMRLALAILHTLELTQAHATVVPQEMAKQLLGPTPGTCMTEAGDEGLDSPCQILVFLCLSHELSALFEPTAEAAAQRARVAMALLAEAVSRSCRVLLRTSPPPCEELEACSGQSPMMLTARSLVRKALGISPESCHDVMADELAEPAEVKHAGEYDVDMAVRASGGFFLKAYTNATPFAVVGCVGVAEVIREWLRIDAPGRTLPSVLRDAGASAALARALAGAFESKRISMRRFLEDHLPGASPPHVQAALYCQGLTYHDSRARRAGLPPLSRSHDLLRTLAENERREVYLARLQRKQGRLAAIAASRRGAVRLAIARAAKAEFMATHEGVPQLFDHAQLARLNATRPPDEQLELMGASPGLLKHHCCYPCCPHFLRDLRSPKDRAAATAAGNATGHGRSAAHFRRHGLFRHLKWFQWPDRSWTKAMHATALQELSRRPALSRIEFVEMCARKLDERRNGMSHTELERLLGLIHDSVTSRL